MRRVWSRREILASLSASVLNAEADKGRTFPSEMVRFPDPVTEFEVYRLTSPQHTSILPAYYHRVVSHRGSFLLFSSDRTGPHQVFRMDLKSGECRQLTQCDALDPASVTLLGGERSFAFFDGPSLKIAAMSNLRERQVYEVSDGWKRCPGFSVSSDGLYAALVESKDGVASRLRLVNVARQTTATVTEAPFLASDPVPRPRRAQILYRQAHEALWMVNFDGQQNRRLRTAAGETGPARWSPDGKTVLYLNFPEEKTRLNAIRELTPDDNTDKMIAPTSQFVHFGANGDASVFVGASRNRAAPHLLILLRVARRELTVCEHRASDPTLVAPIFSEDSQNIFFSSDKTGKPCLYRVKVERFVEKTETDG